MSSTSSRLRLGGAVVIAFLCGLLFASSMDWTRFGYAQQGGGTAVKPTAKESKPMADASNAFVNVAEALTPAVVAIDASRTAPRTARNNRRPPSGSMEDFFNQFDIRRPPVQEQSGSGFIVSADGYILTNNHVVEGADRVVVKLSNGRQFTAKVLGGDPTTDVAVIKIESKNLPHVQLGNDADLRIGEWVLAIGNPLDLDFTVTAGIVSAKGRAIPGLLDRERLQRSGQSYAITDFIQTDAAINPGNSGGPLVNSRGEVVGINSAIASPTGYYSGYGFAIPISLAKDVMDDFIKFGRVRRAVLGIGIDEVDAEDASVAGITDIAGVKVRGFSPDADSPAQKAGVEAGDVITKINGQTVDKVATLQRIVRHHEPGETVDVEVMRYGKRMTFRVKLVEADTAPQVARSDSEAGREDDSDATDRLGINVDTVSTEYARQNQLKSTQRGLVVTEVSATGPAAQKLLERSDILLEVVYPAPRRTLRTVADLQRVLERLQPGQVVSLSVYNAQQGATRIVNVRVTQ